MCYPAIIITDTIADSHNFVGDEILIAAWSLTYIRQHKCNIANLTAKQPPSLMSKSHSRSRLCTFCTWIWLETMLPMYCQNTYYRTQQSLKTSTDYHRRQCKHFCVEPFAWLRHCFFSDHLCILGLIAGHVTGSDIIWLITRLWFHRFYHLSISHSCT